jgi:hypothetical protein
VRTPVDERLRQEAEQYRLRFACPDCVYFDVASGACSEGYPNHEHLDQSLADRRILVFCKSFELS